MAILRLLADGQYHSGESLGRTLGISRAAVWKKLASLRRKGIKIEVRPGKGYRLPNALEAWEAQIITSAMGAEARTLLHALWIEQVTTSTNDMVIDLLRKYPLGGVVCLAEEQTAGRGRRGREWYSPWGRNFYCSVGWVFTEGLAVLEGLSLAVGVAVVRALHRIEIFGVQLKWPNDLEVAGAKLGGILIEVHAEAGGHCQAIIGIGLNLALPDEASVLLGRPVTDLAALSAAPFERNHFAGIVIEELLLLLRDYPVLGFQGVKSEWQALDALLGAPVIVSGLTDDVEGEACGVDESGALRVQTATGILRLQAGEVSLRKILCGS